MSAPAIPAGWIRFAQPSEARLMVGCDVRECGDNARWKRGDQFRCHVHVTDAEPQECNCDQALALKAQLREAAAHVGDLLAGVVSTGGGLGEQGPQNYERTRDAARAWLTAYLAKRPAR